MPFGVWTVVLRTERRFHPGNAGKFLALSLHCCSCLIVGQLLLLQHQRQVMTRRCSANRSVELEEDFARTTQVAIQWCV